MAACAPTAGVCVFLLPELGLKYLSPRFSSTFQRSEVAPLQLLSCTRLTFGNKHLFVW